MIKKYFQFIKEDLDDIKSSEQTSDKQYTELEDEIKSMIEETIRKVVVNLIHLLKNLLNLQMTLK